MFPSDALLEIESPFGADAGFLRVLEPDAASGAEAGLAIAAGTYDKPFIVDEGTTRSLYFTMANIQCVMHANDPFGLPLAYTRAMTAFLLFHPAPVRLALLGLGGGSLAKFCHRHLPETDVTAVEINPHVIALRDAFLVPRDDDRFRVVAGDAAEFVAGAQALDVLLLDAYDRDGLPPALASAAFYDDVSVSLAVDGLFVMNLCGRRHRYVSVIEQVKTAFAGRVVELPVRRDGNVVLFAFKSDSARCRPDLGAHAAQLKRRFGFDYPRYAQRLTIEPAAGEETDDAP
jgi:spermidine synthase